MTDKIPRTTIPTKVVDLDANAGDTLDVAIQVVERCMDDVAVAACANKARYYPPADNAALRALQKLKERLDILL